MNWYKFSQNAGVPIEISLERYKESLWNYLEEISAFSEQEKYRISTIKFEQQELVGLINETGYSNRIDLNNITKEDIDNLYSWYLSLPMETKTMELRSKVKRITDILNHLLYREDYPYFSMENAKEVYNEMIEKTAIEMEKNKAFISEKVARIKGFSSPILIEAYEFDKDNDLMDPETSSSVYVGGIRGPYFTMFRGDEGFIIDDIIDADEDYEMFLSGKIKMDYFSLVNEIQNKRRDKILTLYTARPVRDRQFYINTDRVPANIYLTTDYNRAEGIALELKGSEKGRDIWKVRINSNYLIQTGDFGYIKDYQTYGEEFVPVESMKLISYGEE